MDASGYGASLLMLTVVGRGTPCFPIEAQFYILGGMPV